MFTDILTDIMADIPIVDFNTLGKGPVSSRPSDVVDQLSKDIYKAFSTTGFLYIKNHGIEQEKISNLFDVANAFCELPTETKCLSARPKQGTKQGWVGIEVESTDPTNPGDFKEAFNILEPYNNSLPWPTVGGEKFKETVQDFFKKCEDLALRILDLISFGLDLKDKEFLRMMHQNMTGDKNSTILRVLHYPAVTHKLKAGQLRCGEHSDYGTITLLFQDDVGGLEVCNRNGQFVAVQPIKDTVLVNIGDLLQRWTNNKLISTRHRVVVPEQGALCSNVRHSAVVFVSPNDDAIIECLDGSGNYPAITALDYLNKKCEETYLAYT